MTAAQPAPHRFLALDGLRGVAALCVVFMHVTLWLGPRTVLAGSALAVDFFFCLSGFVLAHAYAARLCAGMTLRRFMADRLQRLYPLLAAGYLLGAGYATLRAIGPGAAGLTPALVAKSLLLSLLLIPHEAAPLGFGIFPLDGPTWSLFFEIVVNLGFAAALRRLGWRRCAGWFAAAIAVSAVFLACSRTTIVHGFTLATLDVGLARVCLSFLIGVLVQRRLAAAAWRLPCGGDVAAAGLGGAMLLCFAVESAYPSVALEMGCLLLLFPAVIVAGALARPRRLARLCHALGELSYPVYVLHAPVVLVTASVLVRLPGLGRPDHPVVMAAAFAASVGAAWLALVLYDQPVRALLRRGTRIAAQPARLAR